MASTKSTLHSLEKTMLSEKLTFHGTVSRKTTVSRRKSIGAFYTHNVLSKFFCNEVFNSIPASLLKQKEFDILEPSVGSGIFLEAICNTISTKIHSILNLTGIDIEARAIKTSKKIIDSIPNSSKTRLLLINKNFFEWSLSSNKKFDIIIGNPPWKLVRQEKSKGKFPDISLDFVQHSLSHLKNNGVLGFLLPGTWLTSLTFKNFRDFLLNQNRNLKVIQFEEKWFSGTGYTSKPVMLIIGPRIPNATLTMSELDEINLSPREIYTTPLSKIKFIDGNRFPIASSTFHRFLETNKKLLNVKIKPTKSWGIKSFAGIKTYDNKKFIFNFLDAKKMLQSKKAEFCTTFSNDEIFNGVKSDRFVLIPFEKGGDTLFQGEISDFATKQLFYIRWDSKAVNYYKSKFSLRNKKMYFSNGLNFSSSGKNCPVFRKSIKSIFDADYPFIPVEEEKLILSLLALFNSPICLYLAKNLVNHTAHFKNQDLGDLPIPNPKLLPDKLYKIGKKLYDTRLKEGQVSSKMYFDLFNTTAHLYALNKKEKIIVWEWFSKFRLKRISI
jgi:hypothetical protein